jgi:hypothetical protein
MRRRSPSARRLLPNLKCHWLTGYKQDEKTGEWKPSLAEVVATLERSHADGLGTQGEMKHVDAEFLEDLCDEGHCEFHVWTIDDPKVGSLLPEAEAVGDHDESAGVHSRAVEAEAASDGGCCELTNRTRIYTDLYGFSRIKCN